MTLGKISDKDIRHCHFLKSTCDNAGPYEGPQSLGLETKGKRREVDSNEMEPPTGELNVARPGLVSWE